MNNPITNECFRLSQEACNYEERRIKGKLISRINWFGAVDGVALQGGGKDKKEDSGVVEKRTWKAINDIP